MGTRMSNQLGRKLGNKAIDDAVAEQTAYSQAEKEEASLRIELKRLEHNACGRDSFQTECGVGSCCANISFITGRPSADSTVAKVNICKRWQPPGLLSSLTSNLSDTSR